VTLEEMAGAIDMPALEAATRERRRAGA